MKIVNKKTGEIRPLGAELLHADERKGGRTHDEVSIRFCNYFANASKNCTNKEMKSRLNSAKACYHSIISVCLPVYYLRMNRIITLPVVLCEHENGVSTDERRWESVRE
jgi:hypothetical protein